MRRHDMPAGLPLGRQDRLADGCGRAVRLALADGWLDGILVRRGDRVFGRPDMCPHAGGRLQRDGQSLTADSNRIVCALHGARSEIGNGRCVAGPGVSRRLDPWPVSVGDGEIVTG